MARKPDLSNYDKYVESGCWKCSKSPTGAHHWLLRDGIWICKYCFDVRVWPMSFNAATLFTLADQESEPHTRFPVPMRKNRKGLKW